MAVLCFELRISMGTPVYGFTKETVFYGVCGTPAHP